jgi:hypothetical protein
MGLMGVNAIFMGEQLGIDELFEYALEITDIDDEILTRAQNGPRFDPALEVALHWYALAYVSVLNDMYFKGQEKDAYTSLIEHSYPLLYKGLRLSDNQEKKSFEKTKKIIARILSALDAQEAATLAVKGGRKDAWVKRDMTTIAGIPHVGGPEERWRIGDAKKGNAVALVGTCSEEVSACLREGSSGSREIVVTGAVKTYADGRRVFVGPTMTCGKK